MLSGDTDCLHTDSPCGYDSIHATIDEIVLNTTGGMAALEFVCNLPFRESLFYIAVSRTRFRTILRTNALQSVRSSLRTPICGGRNSDWICSIVFTRDSTYNRSYPQYPPLLSARLPPSHHVPKAQAQASYPHRLPVLHCH